VSQQDVTPEDQVKRQLSNWLEEHGCTVYWEKEPSYGRKTFSTPSTARPDLLVEVGGKQVALEVKRGDDTGAVYDGVMQLTRYWYRATLDDVGYEFDTAQSTPDAFLLATKHSPHGRLLANQRDGEVKRRNTSGGRGRAVRFGAVPPAEYALSEAISRLTARHAKTLLEQFGGQNTRNIGIGALYSTNLGRPDTFSPDPPGLLDSQPATYYYIPGHDRPQYWTTLDSPLPEVGP